MCEWTPPSETSPSRCTLPPRSFARVNARAKRGVLEDRAVAHGQVDAHQVLEEHAARADRQVAHLRVPHLAVRKPDRLARRREGRVRERGPETVEHRCLGELDRISRAGRGEAPAVEDHERYEREAAIRHRLEKDAASSEAPPTSAPSTAGWLRSSAAFSGLTEPP